MTEDWLTDEPFGWRVEWSSPFERGGCLWVEVAVYAIRSYDEVNRTPLFCCDDGAAQAGSDWSPEISDANRYLWAEICHSGCFKVKILPDDEDLAEHFHWDTAEEVAAHGDLLRRLYARGLELTGSSSEH